MAISGHPSQIPSGLHGVPSGNSEKTLQEKSVEYYQSILNHAPNLHIKFVAFKAAEIALNNGAFQVNELVSEWTNNNQLLKANLPWDVPETATTEHLQLYQYVFERHLTEQLEFIVLTVPDADPEYLEDMVRQYQGNVNSTKLKLNVSKIFDPISITFDCSNISSDVAKVTNF